MTIVKMIRVKSYSEIEKCDILDGSELTCYNVMDMYFFFKSQRPFLWDEKYFSINSFQS